jgi:hypothetical protein
MAPMISQMGYHGDQHIYLHISIIALQNTPYLHEDTKRAEIPQASAAPRNCVKTADGIYP